MSEWKEPNTKNKSKVVEDFMQMKDTLEVMITNLKKKFELRKKCKNMFKKFLILLCRYMLIALRLFL